MSEPAGGPASRIAELKLRRRGAVVGGLAVGAVPAMAMLPGAPTLVPRRPDLTSGVRSGEVTTDSAVIWSRAAEQGRMMVRLGSGRRRHLIRGPWAGPATDRTARVHLRGLGPGREYDATVWFESPDGTRSAPLALRFTTAPIHAARQSVVWSGDTCGQGWGIDHQRGGLTTYRAMLDVRPDVFIHCGDTIYADEEIPETYRTREGTLWRNEVTAEVMVPAETLAQFRGRHRYPLRDHNVRDFYAAVPTIAQWDDHETANNWWPGETLDDDRYTERRASVLATRGRRAWQEYQPVPVRRLVPRNGSGFAPARLYRKVPRGQHLDIFCLDMRSFRGANPDTDPRVAAERGQAGILGPDQERWLVESLRGSTATWKVISADMPLSAPTRWKDDLDSVANQDDGPPLGREPEIARVLAAIKRYGVRNVIWVTADVHYTAAHHYSPERAQGFTDFDPFWEFVSGPIASSPFWAKDEELDQTFGPRVEFSRGESSKDLDITPTRENQYFGHLDIAASGELTVTLRNAAGESLWRRTLEPAGPGWDL